MAKISDTGGSTDTTDDAQSQSERRRRRGPTRTRGRSGTTDDTTGNGSSSSTSNGRPRSGRTRGSPGTTDDTTGQGSSSTDTGNGSTTTTELNDGLTGGRARTGRTRGSPGTISSTTGQGRTSSSGTGSAGRFQHDPTGGRPSTPTSTTEPNTGSGGRAMETSENDSGGLKSWLRDEAREWDKTLQPKSETVAQNLAATRDTHAAAGSSTLPGQSGLGLWPELGRRAVRGANVPGMALGALTLGEKAFDAAAVGQPQGPLLGTSRYNTTQRSEKGPEIAEGIATTTGGAVDAARDDPEGAAAEATLLVGSAGIGAAGPSIARTTGRAGWKVAKKTPDTDTAKTFLGDTRGQGQLTGKTRSSSSTSKTTGADLDPFEKSDARLYDPTRRFDDPADQTTWTDRTSRSGVAERDIDSGISGTKGGGPARDVDTVAENFRISQEAKQKPTADLRTTVTQPDATGSSASRGGPLGGAFSRQKQAQQSEVLVDDQGPPGGRPLPLAGDNALKDRLGGVRADSKSKQRQTDGLGQRSWTAPVSRPGQDTRPASKENTKSGQKERLAPDQRAAGQFRQPLRSAFPTPVLTSPPTRPPGRPVGTHEDPAKRPRPPWLKPDKKKKGRGGLLDISVGGTSRQFKEELVDPLTGPDVATEPGVPVATTDATIGGGSGIDPWL